MSTTEQFQPHPHAVTFPPLSKQAYQALKESIAEHGLQQPIEVQAGGSNLLLDGRHRLRACREVECPVEVRKVKIEDAAVPIYTASKAAQRHGLTATQKVLLALELLPSLQVGSGKKATGAASAVGISRAYVERGITLKEKAPDLFERVEGGNLGLSTAYREYRLRLDGKHEEDPKPDEEDPRPDDDNDERYRISKRFWWDLKEIADAVGGGTTGCLQDKAIEALLDFVNGDGAEAWGRWAQQHRAARETAT